MQSAPDPPALPRGRPAVPRIQSLAPLARLASPPARARLGLAHSAAPVADAPCDALTQPASTAHCRPHRWFIIPIYRLEMRYLPERGLMARSWTVVLDQETLPARLSPPTRTARRGRPPHWIISACGILRNSCLSASRTDGAIALPQEILKGINLNMRMRSVTNVHRNSEEVEEFKDGGKFRKTLLEVRRPPWCHLRIASPELSAAAQALCPTMPTSCRPSASSPGARQSRDRDLHPESDQDTSGALVGALAGQVATEMNVLCSVSA